MSPQSKYCFEMNYFYRLKTVGSGDEMGDEMGDKMGDKMRDEMM